MASFVDRVKIHVHGGDGGNGIVAFRREKYRPNGGPSGGDGGKGGDVFLVTNPQMNSLLDFHFKNKFQGKRGSHGMGSDMHGKNGEDTFIPVPCGTIVSNFETGDIIADMTKDNEKILIAAGGRGGRGNARFATSTNRAPRHATPGGEGEEIILQLDLKLIADVGIIGFPNVGKSTMISKVSAARPKIANYPFTTLVPNLGVVKVEGFESFVIADLPGLVKGAHQGTGLGDRFLRHAERTKLFVHLVDISVGSDRNPVDDFKDINKELYLYNKEMIKHPQVAVAAKMDIVDEEKLEAFRSHCEAEKVPFFSVSSVTGEGIKELIGFIWQSIGHE